MLLDELRKIIDGNTGYSSLFIRNLIKEKIQLYLLNYIYNSNYGENFLFKGGTCLRVCFDLPRLSEDLDFDVKNYQDLSQEGLALNLLKYLKEKLLIKDVDYKVSGQNKIIYLKFPLAKLLSIRNWSASAITYVRIDTAPIESQFYKEEISLKSTTDFSFIIKRYSLADIFGGKIAAILIREKWEGKERQPRFKGRDFFDIFWLRQQKVFPNFNYLSEVLNIKDKKEIINLLEKKLNEGKKRLTELQNDLRPFFREQKFVEDFIKNYSQLKEDFLNYLKNKK